MKCDEGNLQCVEEFLMCLMIFMVIYKYQKWISCPFF